MACVINVATVNPALIVSTLKFFNYSCCNDCKVFLLNTDGETGNIKTPSTNEIIFTIAIEIVAMTTTVIELYLVAIADI